MARYVLRRLISTIPTILGVTIVVFMFLRLIPGDPAVAMLGEHATEENVSRVREQFGLNRTGFLCIAKPSKTVTLQVFSTRNISFTSAGC